MSGGGERGGASCQQFFKLQQHRELCAPPQTAVGQAHEAGHTQDLHFTGKQQSPESHRRGTEAGCLRAEPALLSARATSLELQLPPRTLQLTSSGGPLQGQVTQPSLWSPDLMFAAGCL